jgi:hypothetical protein
VGHDLPPATGDDLIVLMPGNLAHNKGYQDFHQLLNQVESLDLPIRFRVLGRTDPWIRRQLEGHPRVQLLGRYSPDEFALKAAGCDLALFLSPWPETYCITFDEWVDVGRACYFVSIGALAEPHRQQKLHPASRSFSPHAVEDLLVALIEAASPEGRAALRAPLPSPSDHVIPEAHKGSGFGIKHWELFNEVLEQPRQLEPLPWQARPYLRWGEDPSGSSMPQALHGGSLWWARLRGFVYRLPAGYRVARLWRRMRGG